MTSIAEITRLLARVHGASPGAGPELAEYVAAYRTAIEAKDGEIAALRAAIEAKDGELTALRGMLSAETAALHAELDAALAAVEQAHRIAQATADALYHADAARQVGGRLARAWRAWWSDDVIAQRPGGVEELRPDTRRIRIWRRSPRSLG